MTHLRQKICKGAMHTKNRLAYLEDWKDRALEKMRIRDIRNMRWETKRTLMLDAMQMQAVRHWPTLGSLDATVQMDVMLPQTVLNYTEYQEKLQRLAIYADQGNEEAMQEVLDNKNIMARKNKLL